MYSRAMSRAEGGFGVPAVERAPAIVFTPFVLDRRGARLLRDGASIPLRPKTFGVLVYLAERPGELVTKDELLDALWPGIAVTPDTLNKSIGELRVALGDDTRAPRFVETVHRRGFRFIAATGAPAAPPPRVVLEPATASHRPFVGRRHELDVLASAFERARGGTRQLVFVTGPAGVGKSSLVDAFLATLPRHDATVRREPPVRRELPDEPPIWIGRADCFEQHGPREAYLPVLEALQRLAALPDAASLVPLMRRTAPLWLAQMPWLVADAERDGLERAVDGVRPERMPRELAALLDVVTAERTLVLVLEDLHWCDPSTVDLLTLLAQRRESARLLVVGTYRPAELVVREHALAGAARTLQVQQRCTALALDDLDEEAVDGYLAQRFPGSTFDRDLTRMLHEHTGGHPLFLTGIVEHLVNQGWILDTEPGWALSRPLPLLDLGVPDDVRLMIETQLQRLSPPECRLLEAAAVAGSQTSVPLLAAVLERDAADVDAACEAAIRAGHFLRRAGTVGWSGGHAVQRYAFTHELYGKVAYENVSSDRRARLHQRVAETLEAAHVDRAAELAGQLATHFQRGGDAARAVHYLTEAAARSRRLGASREAVEYFEPALRLVACLPDVAERERTELALRLGAGRALGDVHGFTADAVRDNYTRVSELCTRVGTAAELVEVLHARWYLHALRAERDQTLALAAELADATARLGSLEGGTLADSVLARTATYDARFTEAVQHEAALRARFDAAGRGPGTDAYGANPVTAAIMHAALSHWFLGDVSRARAMASDGVARVRATGDRFSLAAALMQASLVDLLAREPVTGEALAAESRAIAAEHGFVYWRMHAVALWGWARVQQDDLDAGREALTEALDGFRASGTRYFVAFVHGFLAEAHLRAGAVADGLVHADAGLAAVETTLDRPYGPELWRLEGELLLAGASDGGHAEAERCLMRALETSRAAGAKSLALRAATSLARLWRATRRPAKARTLLSTVIDGIAGDGADVRAARTLRAELAPAR